MPLSAEKQPFSLAMLTTHRSSNSRRIKSIRPSSMFKHLLVSIVLIVTFALIPTISFAYTSKICAGTTCTAKEVGPFMDGISQECGNSGTCQLSDIMLLITNVGNYVLGIIGAIVLLMYTI